ncbi:low choriolytic enzyme-like [Penaeus monodon]|uniref:low choriolytic enzyme-like n=1 Tax=Penaeus monodon TaxID=6687 RepID=UPI0018A714AE|nr:low choriolytic enzyme-like [Penaeus monodon]
MALMDSTVNFFYNILPYVIFDYGIDTLTFPWPERTVPYRLDENFSVRMRQTIYDAMDEIEKYSCVRFVHYDPEAHGKKVFLDVVPLSERLCFANIGYHPRKSRILGLHQEGCSRRGVVIHEFLHVLGMQHTHQRKDRDEHVEVYRKNVVSNRRNQFHKTFSEYYGLPYDLQSLMHYDMRVFAKAGAGHTMRVREIKDASGARTTPLSYAKKTRMSCGDIAWVNRVYGCRCHYLGDDLPGAMPYADWLKSKMGKEKYDMLDYLVPNKSNCRGSRKE